MDNKFLIWDNFEFDEPNKNTLANFNFNENYDLFSKFLTLKKIKMSNFIDNPKVLYNDLLKYETTVNNVYNRLANENKKLTKVLIFGSIQSGKTDFMIGFSSKILELFKNLNVTIVLSSNNNELLQQTINRYRQSFDDIGAKSIFLTFDDLKKIKDGTKEIKITSQDHIFIFSLKQVDHLRQTRDFLRTNLISDLDRFKNNLTIIDDEGDVASFDNVNTDERTSINEEITNLFCFTTWKKINYISVTATPFAHVMVGEDDDMKPDFAFVLNPGNGYIGIDRYTEEMQKEDSLVVKTIDDKSPNTIESSLRRALVDYYLQCLIFIINTTYFNGSYPRMLINLDRNQTKHEETINLIKDLNNEMFSTNEIRYLTKRLIEDEIKNNFLKNETNNLIVFDEIDDNIINSVYSQIKNSILPKLELISFNSRSKRENKEKNLNFDSSNKENFQIIVGSDKVARGLTFVDLTTTFIVRRTKKADGALQQARWLGYRAKYKDIMKVFLTNDLIDDYINCGWAISYYKAILENSPKNKPFSEIVNRFFPIKIETSELKPVRDSIAYMYYESGKEPSLFNSRWYREISNNQDNINNKNFFIKFTKSKQLQTKDSYKYIDFDNIKEFNGYFFETNKTYEDLFKSYVSIFGKNLTNQLFDKLLNLKSKIKVRYIYDLNNKVDFLNIDDPEYVWKYRRIVTESNDGSYLVFGQGDYRGLFDYVLDKETVYIDIIPIRLWEIDRSEPLDNIFRAKLYLPTNFNESKYSGIVAKNKKD